MLSLSKKPETEKFEIRFTVYAEPGTWDYELLVYLQKRKEMSRHHFKDMAMRALAGFYLPPARINSCALTNDEKRQVINEGIQRLRLQEQNFRELAGLGEGQAVEELGSSSNSYLDVNNIMALEGIGTDKKETEFDPEQMFKF